LFWSFKAFLDLVGFFSGLSATKVAATMVAMVAAMLLAVVAAAATPAVGRGSLDRDNGGLYVDDYVLDVHHSGRRRLTAVRTARPPPACPFSQTRNFFSPSSERTHDGMQARD